MGSISRLFRPRFFTRSVLLLTLAAIGTPIALAGPVPPGDDEAIRARTEPFGRLCQAGVDCGDGVIEPVADAGAGGAQETAALSGEQVYNQYCVACHAAGVAGAPKLGDADAWAPRIAKGMDALYESTFNGLNVMPARGTCGTCSDDDLVATVDWIVEQAQ